MRSPPQAASGIATGLAAFVLERFPFALTIVREVIEACGAHRIPDREAARIESFRVVFRKELRRVLDAVDLGDIDETTPGVSAAHRAHAACRELIDACDGFLAREAIRASFTSEERLEMLRGMILTRAVDNRLKQFFLAGDARYKDVPFQGKGFRSLGQEAVYAAGLRLRRGVAYQHPERGWQGDVVGPIIRDVGVALAMRPEPATIRMVLNAQMGKQGPPMDGKDLHIGDFEWGILPAAAPLAISTLTIAGMAMAFVRQRSGRVAVSFIGEGGSSLGEWHEAINLCAARRLPALFCVENNQTALSTPLGEQSAARVFADKAIGYGVPGLTIDGTDPEAIAAAFAWAADRARAGEGPALIELVCMRMCGHAHHDDMLYLGKEPPLGWSYAELTQTHAYADANQYAFWKKRDPISLYARRLEDEGVLTSADVDRLKAEAEDLIEAEARAVIDAPWPEPQTAAVGVLAAEPPRIRFEPLEPSGRRRIDLAPALPSLDDGLPYSAHGTTFLEAVMLGIADALESDSRVFVYGEDVGGQYGNAFLLLRPLLKQFGERIVNSPLSEAGVLGVCVGAALAGLRPIGEMQFNDFVATGFNQLVNNAAKIRYRWGGSVPMVVRMPWGGRRHAGPYHSQNTEPWFYRTPGLKIVVPSTPQDARALMASAIVDPDPVLYYEHIALYRDPSIKQLLPSEPPVPMPLGRAALRRRGDDLGILSYGAYVHVALRVADRLAAGGIEASVLDLRSLSPLDKDAVLAVARHCSRVLIVHEDSRTGGIGESLAAIIQEEAFESLDAPVRILGALDTPVPYSPPLEEYFLPSEEMVERAARLLLAY
ncbi:MAG: alpha-ketoacid dehydrogenase subunit alpha/beta [Vicinamibacterales bacterium]